MDIHSLASFADEMSKIAVADSTDFRPDIVERRRRFILDAGAGALGFGLGYGAGSAAGRLIGHKHPGSKWMPLAVAGIGAGGALLSRITDKQRQRYVDEPIKHYRERRASGESTTM